MNQYELTISETEASQRIDKVLTAVNDVSRSQIQEWINQQLILVNGNQVKANYKCQLNDLITWKVPEEKKLELIKENIPLEIIYEDEAVAVVNKPQNMVVYPTLDHPSGTLVNALLYHFNELSTLQGEERPGIVHRLDKDTSGLLLIAKTNEAHENLTKQLIDQSVKRVYEAIVHGELEHDQGIIDAPIGRDTTNRTLMNIHEDGKEAITHFRVIERFKDFTYIECQLKTGRTHQIRVHLKYINHPIAGDERYKTQKTLAISGQALFAKRIGFNHPVSNEWLEFSIEPPAKFEKILTNLKKMS